jgi:hypothetical protein
MSIAYTKTDLLYLKEALEEASFYTLAGNLRPLLNEPWSTEEYPGHLRTIMQEKYMYYLRDAIQESYRRPLGGELADALCTLVFETDFSDLLPYVYMCEYVSNAPTDQLKLFGVIVKWRLHVGK